MEDIPFFAQYEPEATWFNLLEPAFGEKKFFFEEQRVKLEVRGESDATMGFNPMPQAVVDRTYMQVRFGHSESPFDFKKIREDCIRLSMRRSLKRRI